MAPKAIENSAATTDAPEKSADSEQRRVDEGVGMAHAVRAANSAERRHRTDQAPMSVAAEPQPQPLPLTRPSVSAPVPSVTRAVPNASGRGTGCPSHARQTPPAQDQRSQPDRHVDQKHPAPARRDQQASGHRSERSREATHGGPSPDRARPALGGGSSEDEAQGSGGEERGPGGLHEPERDQHRQAGRGTTRG